MTAGHTPPQPSPTPPTGPMPPPQVRAPGWEYFGAAVIATLAFLLATVIGAAGWHLDTNGALVVGAAGATAAWLALSRSVRRTADIQSGKLRPGGDGHTLIASLTAENPQLKTAGWWLVAAGVIGLMAGPIWWLGAPDGWSGLFVLRALARYGLIAVPTVGIVRNILGPASSDRWRAAMKIVGVLVIVVDGVLFLVSGALSSQGEPWNSIQQGYLQLNVFSALTSPGFFVYVGGALAVWLGASLILGRQLPLSMDEPRK